MFTEIIYFILSSTIPLSGYEQPSPIQAFPWEIWNNQLISEHLTNMTSELLKDVIYKLNQADKIQEQYKFSVTYELGTIAAGIQELYKHMIEVYRTFSNLTDFIENKYDVYKTLNAYHILQSDYNQIKVESNLFYDILDRYEKRRREYQGKKKKFMDRLKAKQRNQYTRPPATGGRRIHNSRADSEKQTVSGFSKRPQWSANSDAFDQFYDVDFWHIP